MRLLLDNVQAVTQNKHLDQVWQLENLEMASSIIRLFELEEGPRES